MNELPDPRGPTYRLPSPPPPDPTGWHALRRRARSTLWPPRAPAWAALLAIAVAAAGLRGLWFQATLPGRLPAATDWQAVAGLLSRDARPGDAVALAPPWAERGRAALPDRIPSRPDAPLPVLALPSYAAQAEDLAGIRRVWLVALPRAPGGPGRAAEELAARASTVDGPIRIGRIELTRYDLREPSLPAWSLSGRLGDAVVTGGSATREVREVAGLPRTCAVLRPDGAAPIVLRLPPARLGSVLRVHAGPVGDGTGAGPFVVRLLVDGVEVGRLPGGAPAWSPARIDAARLSPGEHAVSVEATVAGPAPVPTCVELEALP